MFIFKSLFNLLETLTDYALKELYDEKELKKKLMELAVLYEMGEIDEEQFNELEKKLLAQLVAAREYHRARMEEDMENDEEDMEDIGAVLDKTEEENDKESEQT